MEETTRDEVPRTMPLAGYTADGRICRDLACHRCGYNLRTLACDARCPECDFAVGVSLRSADPSYADPRWLRRISRGLMLAAFMPAMLVVMQVLAALLRLDNLRLARAVLIGSTSIPFIGWLVGVWIFAMPDPYRLHAKRLRRLIRPATIFFVATILLAVIEDGALFPWLATMLVLAAAFWLNVSLIISYAFRLTRRLLPSEIGEGMGMLMPIIILGLIMTALGLILSMSTGTGVGLLAGGTCVMLPIGALINLLVLQVAYKLHRFAAKTLQAGES